MKRTLLFALLLNSIISFGQVTIQAGTTVTVLSGTNLVSQQDITVQNLSSLIVNGTVQLKSNFSNNGTLTVNATGKIIMNGTGAQNFNSSVPLSLPVLSVNSLSGITLNNSVTITDSLDLQIGIINTSASAPLHFAAGSKTPLETSSSYISGTAIMDARSVGTAAMNQFLGTTISAGSDVGNVTVTRITGPSAIVTVKGQTSVAASWQFSTSVTPASPDRNLTLSWLSPLDNMQNAGALNLFGSTGANYIRINPVPVNASTNPRLFAQNSLASFNQSFIMSSANMNLPVTLDYFEAARQNDHVVLNWATSIETGIAGFDIQRATDGINFSNIGFTQPAANTGINKYEYNDNSPIILNADVIYYRIKMSDIDGKFTYSPVRSIRNDNNALTYQVSAYPNPFKSKFTLHITKANTEPVHVTIVNKNGAAVYAATLPASRNESLLISLPASLLPGVYFMKVAGKDFSENIKLIKTN